MAEQKLAQSIEWPLSNPESGINRAWEKPAEQIAPATDAPVLPTFPVNQAVNNVSAREIYKDARLVEIENILEQDLGEVYFNLSDEAKVAFKTEGEITAHKINSLLGEAKVAAQKIVDLIVAWLSVLSGVNRFFVEQEAKIKTDKILMIAQKVDG